MVVAGSVFPVLPSSVVAASSVVSSGRVEVASSVVISCSALSSRLSVSGSLLKSSLLSTEFLDTLVAASAESVFSIASSLVVTDSLDNATMLSLTGAEEVEPEAVEEYTTSFDVSYGSHWDSSVAPYGANVADTTASGSISFDAPVQSFTISVDGTVTNDACNNLDWRYSITNNNDGTYTVTYTANQYEYNPPVSFIDGLRFTVNGDQAPVITVVEYTFY